MQKFIQIIALIGKIAGAVAAVTDTTAIPGRWGVYLFAASSILKDVANRLAEAFGPTIPPK